MKINIYILFFLSSTLFSNSEKYMVEITFDDITQLQKLVALDIDLDHHRTLEEVHAFVNDKEYQLISEMDFGIQKIPNKAKLYYNELIKNTTNSRNPMEDYHNYIELTAFLQNIAQIYPDITKLESIGQSVQGRELWVMEISDNPGVNEIEPEFKYVANMHGDETVGRELSLYLIEWLVEGYGINSRATNLINNIDIYIMPTMNPDGFENGSRYNANGVDLNRDFPDQFNDPNNSTFNREPETQAMMDWTSEHHFVLSANMHTGALVANYPFDGPSTGVYSAAPDNDLFVNLALTYANAHPDMASGGFSNGITNGSQWYAISGGMQDWNYVWESGCDITLEQNEVKWPNSNQLANLWEEHREPLLVYLEKVFDGVRGTIVDASSGEPLNANISITGIDHDITNDPENGDYYRLLIPGTYVISVEAFGYIPQSNTITVPLNGYITQNFFLDLDESLIDADIETFEQGNFSNFNWEFSGNAMWQTDNNEVFEGSYSARSGNISENEESSIMINLDIIDDGQLSFYKKVSCESTGSITGNYYDYLAFFIDGVEMDKWAGEIDWSLEVYPITSGNHTFEWVYLKDGGVTSGYDTAWIDFIVFPSLTESQCILGDLNTDGINNVLDIVLLVNCILESTCLETEYSCASDLNEDGGYNVLDVVLLVNSILDS